MAGTIHKISAGCGYEYLTRSVAAMDATDKGRITLSDYYSAKGESPGRWLGSGLSGLAVPVQRDELVSSDSREVEAGQIVTAEQMRALFGEGRHPNADLLEAEVAEAGGGADDQLAASALGNRWSETTVQPLFRVRLAETFIDENLAAGRHWAAPISDERKAEIRTELGMQMFTEEYGRSPADDRELSGWMAQINRPKPQGVAGYDLTFSPVKSVSTLWALGYTSDRRITVDGRTMDVSQAIEHAHDQAVADAISFIEQHAAFGRLGTNGVQQVDSEGLIAGAFTHRDARSGDPDLHTHVAVANKVRVKVPGSDSNGGEPEYRWVALDGTPLFKAMVTASEVYNSRIETHLRNLLGVEFADRANADKSKRAVREIVGVPEALTTRWSQRRKAIETRRDELAAEFQATHHREPTSTELYDLAQQATLETRDAKHEPRSLNEQRETWMSQAVDELGSESEVARSIADALPTTAPDIRKGALSTAEARGLADIVVRTVSTSRAQWQRPHLRAEAERQLRQGSHASIYHNRYDDNGERLEAVSWDGWISPEQWSTAVEQIVTAAQDLSVPQTAGITDSDLDEPQMMRRADGASVYSTHDTDLFTSDAILAAEQRIIASARRSDGRVVDDIHVDLALLEAAANGRALNAGQTALVRELATSGRRVQLALAPAGTGKTYAMRTFGNAWSDSGGTILGLAPTAAAAAVLREDLGTETETLAKLVHVIRQQQQHDRTLKRVHAEAGPGPDGDRKRRQFAKARPFAPEWFRTIGAKTVIIVDEAGMASTEDLDVLISFAQSRGAAVRLVGDDQQLASISAGGVLRDIAAESGALTLSRVVRFSDTAEGAASLALRNGDVAGLGYLADHDRIHVAADTVAAEQAFAAWVTDRADGHDAVMLAATRETTNQLNQAAREHRLAHQQPPRKSPIALLARRDHGREVTLADGLTASVGDTICTRRNDRTLRASATDWVRNGDRWEITKISKKGELTVRHQERGRTLTLPADYVAASVTLGYASTIHAAQGMTADHCHVVGSDMLNRQLLYVAMTRGRHSNHIYLSTAEGDPHKVLTPKALTPGTAIEVLSKVLDRDESQKSATTAAREAADPFNRIEHSALSYSDAIGTLAEARVGAERLAAITDGVRALDPDIVEASGWPVLRKSLAVLELTPGTDPLHALTTAYRRRELDTARDVAVVLDWRLEEHLSTAPGPLPWLRAVPPVLPPEHITYLNRRRELVTDLADQIHATVGEWTVHDAPAWARPYLAAQAPTDVVADLAVYRAVHDIADNEMRPAGPPNPHTGTRKHQRSLEARAAAVIDATEHHAKWSDLARELDAHIVDDPYWPRLAEQFTELDRAGLDVQQLTADAVADQPLPTELPAAALWWRLSRTVEPATLSTQDSGLRPDWINDVADVVGPHAAEVIIADPAWPSLVAAVEEVSAPQNWTARELLSTAHEALTAAAEDAGENLRADHLARALARRIEHLVHYDPQWHADVPLPEHEPVSALDLESVGPDLHDPQTDPYLDTIEASAPDDDSYLESLLADGPPPEDDLSVPPPPVDTWPELDFTDHYPSQPATPTPDRDRDFADLIADYYELSARRREVTADLDAMRATIDLGHGAHTSAATPLLRQLDEHAAAQRPYRIALHEAREQHDALTHRSQTLTTALADIDAELAAMGRTLAYDDGTPDLSEDAVAADALRADHSILAMQLRAVTEQLPAATAAVDQARAALTEAEATYGGRAVTADDVTVMRLHAESIDRDALDDLRAERDHIDGQLMRIESALAHRHALTRTGPDSGYSLPEATESAEIAALTDTLAADPVQMVPDKALHSTIRAVRKRISALRADMLIHTGTPTDREAAVRREHARIDTQVEAIESASTAAALVDDAAAVVTRARAALAEQSAIDPATLPRRERAEHQASIERLTDALTRATTAHHALRAKADDAARAVAAPAAQWPTILSSADPRRRRTELDRARTEDARAAAATAKDRADLEQATAKLDRALAEVDRRETLDPHTRELEDQVRAASTDEQQTPVKQPSTAATSTSNLPTVDLGPDPNTSLGPEM